MISVTPLVIGDSSTLIHLASIGQLTLLRDLYGKITIPEVVWREVVTEGGGRPGVSEVTEARNSQWIEVSPVMDTPLLRLLKRDLDDGEAAVIALAIERQADLVLIDEAAGRRIAELYGLSKTGVIGILLRAKKEARIPSLKRELEKLRQRGRFRIDERLVRQALHAAGE